MTLKNFPFFKQMDSKDCGPTCLQMIAKYHGKSIRLADLRKWCHLDREGVSLRGLAIAAEQIGYRTLSVKLPFEASGNSASLIDIPLPAILHWNHNHFVVAYKIDKKYVWIADPNQGKVKLDRNSFMHSWATDVDQGIALILEKSREFDLQAENNTGRNMGLAFLMPYISPYLQLLRQVGLGLLAGSLLSLLFPFLTQSIVDIGVQNKNISFVYLILIGQIFLFISQTFIQFVQSWIMLHVGTRMNVALVSDFLAKLMKLPLKYFDIKTTGDLLQRISDHKRIETFLTQSTLSVLFSVFNFFVFSVVLSIYSFAIFGVFLVTATLHISWIIFFLKKRKEIDYKSFIEFSKNQDAQIEIIQGMQEIKLQGSQLKRRWKWAEIQARLFRIQIKGLALAQYQEAGALFINQLKDIIITVLAATAVIEGELTLGMMLAIQYIIGQLNAPLQQLVSFVRSAQDAQISLSRLGEIHQEEEEINEQSILPKEEALRGDLVVNGVSFRYNPLYDWVINDISLTIPQGKVTAIVGASGSGKTTLLKLLLGFYPPEKGHIKINNLNLKYLNADFWRKQCGVVMQDGYIFSDNIANNTAESDDQVDYEKLAHAIHIANIDSFLEGLPLGLQTMIGAHGNGLSQGQKQRLLIARAIYKDPQFLFFDEATNALDASNERTIVDRLNQFFQGRTVVVVAHRLSTVRNADQIIVLDKGKIEERGIHQQLIELKGIYYNLVKNQLELGN